jgi:hypothetical protein
MSEAKIEFEHKKLVSHESSSLILRKEISIGEI